MRKVAFLFVLVILCPLRITSGQQSGGMKVNVQGGEQDQPRQPLTNDSITGFVKIGFSDETIVSMIEHEPGNYSLRADDVAALKKAGVSERVITAMSSKMGIGPTPAPQVAAPVAPPPVATEGLAPKDLGAAGVHASAEKSPEEQTASPALTNKDVVDMLKVGLTPSIVIAKIKTSKCSFDTSPAALQALKAASVPDEVILVMVENPSGTAKAAAPPRLTDDLTTQFKRMQNSVVTVWSEFGHGTGFIVDSAGLVLTNQHVVGPSEYIAVQFDERRKLPAVLLAADPEKDIAVLRTNFSVVAEAIVAPIAQGNSSEPLVVEGERVFTIGSPLHQTKILTTGIVSKLEAHAILSDININHGNSGGPLFNSAGAVVGITTFHDPDLGGAGVSGIVRIEEVTPVLEQAKIKMAQMPLPEPTLLPVEPTDTFPIEALKETLMEKKFDRRPYLMEIGDYDVAVITPPLHYYLAKASTMEAAREKEKRTRKQSQAVHETFRPLAGCGKSAFCSKTEGVHKALLSSEE